MSTRSWSIQERSEALVRAEREGVDVLVIGGGITGAGVLRDLATRGLRALLVERNDFASGTSSRSSKFIHGGLRYIAEGHLGMTRESCRERDLLMRLNPHLVRPVPFLFPAYEGGKMKLWQIRTGLHIYSALSNFRRTARFQMLGPEEVAGYCGELRQEGLRGAGLYQDGQADDARLVIETLRSARSLGAEAVNHAELLAFQRSEGGSLEAAQVRDGVSGSVRTIRAHAFVNAAGPAVERVRGLDQTVMGPELRPAKGVHLVIPRDRIHAAGCVTFAARDGRQLFLVPWDDVALLGTTDAFTDEIDEPVVTIEEVHYILSAANDAFPRAALTTNDLRSVYAGVRPLVAAPDEQMPSTAVSREHRIYEDPSGLLSVAGGKLTTHRATGEMVADRALAQLPADRRAAAGPSRTAELPLRESVYDAAELEAEIGSRFGLSDPVAERLARAYGPEAETLLAEAPVEEHRPIDGSRYLYAELRWSVRTECPLTLCDLLERRIRLAMFSIGQGLPELDELARIAGEAAGWDADRVRKEAAGYAAAVRRSYQIAPPAPARHAA